MVVYAVIPARSGSKGLPHKNIRLLRGYPLLAWSVVAASGCTCIDRTFVSTDSQEYAEIAIKYGAEAPFLRPAALAGDSSRDSEFLLHCVEWWRQHGIACPDFIVLLRPTTPLRESIVLDAAIQKIQISPQASSLCSGFELPESPVKNFRLGDDGMFYGFMGDAFLALRRQECPKAYVWDGYIDILRTDRVIAFPDDIYGPRRLAMITPQGIEIDTIEEFEMLELFVQKKGHPLLRRLKERENTHG